MIPVIFCFRKPSLPCTPHPSSPLYILLTPSLPWLLFLHPPDLFTPLHLPTHTSPSPIPIHQPHYIFDSLSISWGLNPATSGSGVRVPLHLTTQHLLKDHAVFCRIITYSCYPCFLYGNLSRHYEVRDFKMEFIEEDFAVRKNEFAPNLLNANVL